MSASRARSSLPFLLAFSLWTSLFYQSLHASAAFETDHLRVEINEDATLRSVLARKSGIEYAALSVPCPVAKVYRGGRMVPIDRGEFAPVTGRWIYSGGSEFPAVAAKLAGDLLTLDFGPAKVRATCRFHCTARYLTCELLGLEGEPVDRIEFFRVRLRRLPSLGQWMGAVYDDRFGICCCAGNLSSDVELLPEEQSVLLTAAAESRVTFRGPTAVLFGTPEPKSGLLEIMEGVERDLRLPPGVANRRDPLQRCSYLWASDITPQNVDQFIHFAKLGGFRMLLLSYTAFSRGAGHFAWNEHYSGGMEDLRRVTEAIRSAGLRAGLHIHYNKASKRDSYVSPAPDKRLHALRSFRLTRSLDRNETEVAIDSSPEGCTLDRDRRILRLGTELIEYEGFSTQSPFCFTGCRRAVLGTTAMPHSAGSGVDLLDVDSWPAFIRFDQDTDIQDEAARRIASIYRQTGPYDLVYFDGAEDVHEPFWYHVASAQDRVYRLLEPRPPVCETAQYTHFGWHMMNRANAYDVVAEPEAMKDFCRLMPCPTAAARELDFSRIDFGWLGRFGESTGKSAGPDVYEYVASRAAAWDCPLSLHVRLRDLETNPRGEDCLAVFKTWEDARLGNHLSPGQREQLKNVSPPDAHYVPCFEQRKMLERVLKDRDLTPAQRRILADRREHHLFLNEQGRYELVEIEEVSGVAEGKIRAFTFHRAAKPGDAYALVWAAKGEQHVEFPLPAPQAMRPFGVPSGNSLEIVIGPRTYLFLPGMGSNQSKDYLRNAKIQKPIQQ